MTSSQLAGRSLSAPQLLCEVPVVLGPDAAPAGALWSLPVPERQLDANVIRLAADGQVDEHVGPDLDVLMYVLAGSGEVGTEGSAVPVSAGSLVWLPRRSRRAIRAGGDGLAYLTVHPKRPGLTIGPAPVRPD